MLGKSEAERTHEIVVSDVVASLKTFQHLIEANADKPDRIKFLLPRFIDYVVRRAGEKGEGSWKWRCFRNRSRLRLCLARRTTARQGSQPGIR